MRISIIAAIGENRELGGKNKLLWNIPGELKRFKEITTGHPIIMGRKTFISIGRILPNRTNIIITRDPKFKIDGAIVVNSLDQAIEKAKKSEGADEIFIIGGGEIFAQALLITDRLYVTIVHKSFPDADVFFPEYKETFTKELSKEDMPKNPEGPEFPYTFLTLGK